MPPPSRFLNPCNSKWKFSGFSESLRRWGGAEVRWAESRSSPTSCPPHPNPVAQSSYSIQSPFPRICLCWPLLPCPPTKFHHSQLSSLPSGLPSLCPCCPLCLARFSPHTIHNSCSLFHSWSLCKPSLTTPGQGDS